MKHKISSTASALAHEIAALRQATPADLKERWRALYCTEPPRRISRDLLVRALAYRIQEKALGGLKPSTRRLLARVAAAASAHRPMRVAPQPTLKPLSEVSYRITGTKWSGPRFFGLKSNHQERGDGTV